MAIHAPITGARTRTPDFPPLASATLQNRREFGRYPTREVIALRLEEAIDRYIALLDQIDDDPDLEDGGDLEPNGDGGDVSWPEWHERGFFKLQGNGHEFLLNGGGDDDDEANGDELDGSFAEDEGAAVFGDMTDGPGCLVADPDVEVEWRGEEEWPGCSRLR